MMGLRDLVRVAVVALSLVWAWPASAEMSPREAAALINPSVFTYEGCTATKIGPREYLTALHCAASLRSGSRLESIDGEYVFLRSVIASVAEKRVGGQSKREDWAILVASADSKAPAMSLGCGEKLVLGAPVAYIGFPMQISRQLGVGYIASVEGAPSNGASFFIDVPGAPGASGSAIVSLDSGHIIGVLTEGVLNTRTTEFFLVGVESVESLDVCEDWDRAIKYWETHDMGTNDLVLPTEEDAAPAPAGEIVDHT